jgi:V8-like Glu-specific endopeptidase
MRTFLLAVFVLLLALPTFGQSPQSLQEVASGCKAYVTAPGKWLGPCENGLADGRGVLEEGSTRCVMHLLISDGKAVSWAMERICPVSGNPHDYTQTVRTTRLNNTNTIKAHQLPTWAGYAVTGVHTENLRAANRARLASSAATRCDEIAALESDPNRVARPPKVRPEAAEIVRTCKAALAKDPGNPRLLTQLAMALRSLDGNQATLYLKEAARTGYAEAAYQLARDGFERWERSSDLDDDLKDAILYGAILEVEQAVKQGHPRAILLDSRLFDEAAEVRYESLRNERKLPAWAKVKQRRLALQTAAGQTFDLEAASLATGVLNKHWTVNPSPATYLPDDPREYVSDVTRYPFSAVGKLYSVPIGICTAAVVGDRRTIVSNLHCIPAGWPVGKPLLFDLQGRTPYSSVKAAASVGDEHSIPAGLYRARLWKMGRIRNITAGKYDKEYDQDWAIFNLDHPVPEHIRPLGLISQLTFDDYEQGKFKNTVFHVAAFAEDADHMKRMIYVTGCGIPPDQRVVSARAYNPILDCPSYSGTSGAPILLLAGSEFRLFGLHFGGAGKITGRRLSRIHVSWDLIEAVKQKTSVPR